MLYMLLSLKFLLGTVPGAQGGPCGSGQVTPGRLTSCCQRGVWGQAKPISSCPGISHSMTSPFSKIFSFLLFHQSLSHSQGRQIKLVSYQ